ncbi:MAG: VWA domain-containing protein [Kordiimonadaceae bacterium]|nr:VWA domain-containing protein [Kordiimonadaceae bacterium]MBO6569625.1 VWA domain-containing protein [Kordiimonadaceae bacterium]MBO6966160.1 VWA domain-containing protein [Kordiimonadaceae bacterium]
MFMWSQTQKLLNSSFLKFARDERGSLVPAVAGSMLMLTGAAGLSIDGARMFYVKDVLQKSLDSAGLAAGHAMDVDTMEDDAREFFDANIGAVDNLAASSDMQITISDDNELITLTAEATVDATFMSIFGFGEITVSASTEISRETRGMELVLVMDNTGSMRHDDKIDTMKEAATNLIQTVYGEDNETNPNLWVGVVPYVTHVNVGSANEGWLSADGQTLVDTGFPTTDWMGCIAARDDGLDETDDPPSEEGFMPYYWEDTDYEGWHDGGGFWEFGQADNNWFDETNGDEITIVEANDRYDALGPNRGCGEEITPLVAEKTTVTDAIDAMAPWSFGGTATPMGLVWGWRVLSPRWRGFWAGSDVNLPMDHDTPFMDKVIVILTDGKNEVIQPTSWPDPMPWISDYTAYGRIVDMGHDNISDARDDLDDRFDRICVNAKADGIIIYSITFGSTPDDDVQTAFENCATNPAFYFHAPTASSLETAFDTIGRQLSNLRLSK